MNDHDPIKIDLDKSDPTNRELQAMLRYLTVQVTFMRHELDTSRTNQRRLAGLIFVFALTALITNIVRVMAS